MSGPGPDMPPDRLASFCVPNGFTTRSAGRPEGSKAIIPPLSAKPSLGCSAVSLGKGADLGCGCQ